MVTKLPIDSGQSSIAITGSGPCAVALRVLPVDGDCRYQGVPGRSQNRPMFQGVEGPAAGVIDRQLVTAL